MKSNMSIFSKFMPIDYEFTSCFNLEISITTMMFDENLKSENMQIKKKLNLREVINLQLAEKQQRIKMNKADNRIFLTQLHDLANFLIYKVKTSNIFNISLSMKDDDRHDEEDDLVSAEENYEEEGGDFDPDNAFSIQMGSDPSIQLN